VDATLSLDADLIRLLLKLFLFLLLIALFSIPTILLLSAVQPTALVESPSSMDHEDVERITNLLRHHDPRTIRDGEFRHLSVTGRDLNLGLNYALRDRDRSRTLVELDKQSATARYSYTLPDNPVGKYFNMSVRFVQAGPRLTVGHIDFGRVKVPGQLVNPVVNSIDSYLRGRFVEYAGIMASVKTIHLATDELQLVYQWQDDLADQLKDRGRDLLLPEADRLGVEAYYVAIALESREFKGKTSLTTLLEKLFILARIRTQDGNDPRAEHRALFLSLGLAISGSSYNTLLGEKTNAPAVRPAPMALTLSGRGDLAQHFALSAAISAAGGGGLADAVGIFKELNDSRGGSGFSFVDLLADRAGVELAQRAMGPDAEKIQDRMTTHLKESDYMPDINNLPEGLLELEFKSLYEDLDSRDYTLVNDEIQRRIDACSVYQ
jgi:hypothetical protein